jgi:hypothetical protein
VAIDSGVPRNFRSSTEQADCQRDKRRTQRQDDGSDGQRGEQTAEEMQPQGVRIASAVGLRHQAGGAHAEKTEGPEDSVEKDAAHGHAAQRCWTWQVTREDCVHCGEQRLGQIGEDEGNRQQENPPVPGSHGDDCSCKRQ